MPAQDDRLLGTTRAVSAFIAPFLLVAFVVLYGLPGSTGRLWAWPIKSHMTSMLLASAYLGGCYFFVRVLLVERRWTAVRPGFAAVTAFASLLAVATLKHWDLFLHRHLAFWLWAGLYFTAPFLVAGAWVVNQRATRSVAAAVDEPRLGRLTRALVAGAGALALVTGVAVFTAPGWAAGIWPWPLTPLTARVVGATFCLGAAGLVVLLDDRFEAVRLMQQVQLLMLTLIGVAAVRARQEFLTDRPLTWVLAAGFVVVLVCSAVLAVSGRVTGPRRTPRRRTRRTTRPA